MQKIKEEYVVKDHATIGKWILNKEEFYKFLTETKNYGFLAIKEFLDKDNGLLRVAGFVGDNLRLYETSFSTDYYYDNTERFDKKMDDISHGHIILTIKIYDIPDYKSNKR